MNRDERPAGTPCSKRDIEVVWPCRNCGYLHTAPAAPGLCAACIHPQAYLELLAENW